MPVTTERVLGRVAIGSLSIAAATLVVAAGASCGHDDATPAPAPAPVPTPSGQPPAVDAGDLGTCPAPASQLPDVSTIDYKPAGVTPGACTTDALLALEALNQAQPEGVSPNDMRAALHQQDPTDKCLHCVFGPPTGTWPPIVEVVETLPEGGTQTGVIFNPGGCMDVVSGKPDCGKAWDENDLCTSKACQGCETEAQLQQCLVEVVANGAVCANTAALLETACGADYDSDLRTCFHDLVGPTSPAIEGSIIVQCIGVPSDGGVPGDGGDAGDAGDGGG